MTTNNVSPGFGRSLECDAIAPLLALRDTGLLDAEEAARVERHLATCATCQRDAALDGALASHLRRALISSAPIAPTLTVRQIAHTAAETPTTSATIADTPTEPPTTQRHASRSRSGAARWLGGLPALAAALTVIVLAAYIFGSASRNGARPSLIPTATLSPLLAQQTVYLPSDVGVYALRASDGAVRWTFPPGIATTPITNSQRIFGLVLDHGTLYTLAASGVLVTPDVRLIALDVSSGAVRWSVPVPGPSSASLVQAGDLIIVAPSGQYAPGSSVGDRTVEAFSAASGKLQWSRSLDEPPLSTPIAADGSIYLATPHRAVALDAATGVIRWTTPIVPGAYQQGNKPAGADTSVALSAADGHIYVLAKRLIAYEDSARSATWEVNLYDLAPADGTHRWRDTIEGDLSDTAFAPTLAGNVAFVSLGGGMTALSLANDTPEPLWRFVPSGSTTQNEAMTGAVVSGGIVYTTDLSGVTAHHANGASYMENCTYAIRASDGAELWRSPTNGGLLASTPVVASGLVLAPSFGVLRALRAGDGRQLWSYILPGGSKITTPLLGS